MKNLIVGCGPTGLGAAYRLLENGESDWMIVDYAPKAGGLASSFKDHKGYTWDVGGHVQFSHYDYFDSAMTAFLGDEWYTHERESWVWIKNRFVPYPFQKNIHRLDPDDQQKVLDGLADRVQMPTSKPTFRNWMDHVFGSGLVELFMLPYNRKVWAYDPERLSASWVGERVTPVSLEDVEEGLRLKEDRVSWGPNSTFRFPKEGGTGRIWEECAKRVDPDGRRIRYRVGVESIDAMNRTALLSDGTIVQYQNMISTMPLIELAKTTGMNEDLCSRLMYSSSNIIGIGMYGEPPEHLKKKCWMYFPEDDCPFYRVTVFSNYSPANVPSGRWSLMAEVASSAQYPHNGNLVLSVIDGMKATNLVEDSSKIESVWVKSAKYGYPTPSIDRDDVLELAIPAFERHGIYSRGRFGMWRYEVSNQDHSFCQGVEVVDRLMFGAREMTAFSPAEANARKHPLSDYPFGRKE